MLKQMQEVAGTIKFDKIDPNKLDMKKLQGAAATQADMSKYQQKYQQGKINNGVVIPLGSAPAHP